MLSRENFWDNLIYQLIHEGGGGNPVVDPSPELTWSSRPAALDRLFPDGESTTLSKRWPDRAPPVFLNILK